MGGQGAPRGSHSLQDWLELDPGPPCHHTQRVVPSTKGWAGPEPAPTPRLMECSGRPGWALCPPCQAWATRPHALGAGHAPAAPTASTRSWRRDASFRPQGPVDSGGPT